MKIVDILNRHKFLGCEDWRPDDKCFRFFGADEEIGWTLANKIVGFLLDSEVATPTAEPSADQLLSAFESLPADEAVRVIRSMTPPEPTTEECLAAINRAGHRGVSAWKLFANAPDCFIGFNLNHDEIRGVGKLLIERERAEREANLD
jgi:hypothetical protein